MTIPTELDWVSERARCSPSTVLEALEKQVRSDVEQRNSVRHSNELDYGVEFSLQAVNDAFMIVARRNQDILGTATFGKTVNGINVQYRDQSPMEGSLTLGNDGRCRLRVESEELEFWQFRRKALEPLFFDLFARLRG